jgi:hypothetical protein
MAVLVLVEGVAIALLAVLVAGLLRSHAQILGALHRLEAGDGARAPEGAHRPADPASDGA